MTFSTHSAAPSPVHKTTLLSSRIVYDGWGRFLVAKLQLFDGLEIEREIEDHGLAVAVLPYDPERRIAILVKQMRPPPLFAAGVQTVLEVPAGRLDNESPQSCAKREVSEETGLRLEKLEPVAVVWPMPSVSTEQLHLFLASFSAQDHIGPGGGLIEEQERITVEEIDLQDLARLIDKGELVDLKTVTLVFALRLRRPELFVD